MSSAGLCSNRQQCRNRGRHRATEWLIASRLLLLHHPIFPSQPLFVHIASVQVHGETGLSLGTHYKYITLFSLCVFLVLPSSTICRSWGTAHLWQTKSSSRETTAKEPPASFRPSSPRSWRAGWGFLFVSDKPDTWTCLLIKSNEELSSVLEGMKQNKTASIFYLSVSRSGVPLQQHCKHLLNTLKSIILPKYMKQYRREK